MTILNISSAPLIRWGIIGCGHVTEQKSGPAFQQAEGSALHAVMRRDAAKARDYAQRHGVPVWTDDAAALIADPDVNAIYVATPPSTHAAYAIAAMRAGKPVYVEKPMACTAAECAEMNRVSRETGVPLFVAYYRRTLPGFLKVKEWIDNEAIGRPLVVQVSFFRPATPPEKTGASWRVDPSIAGAGLFYDLASHQLDYLDFLFGPVLHATGHAEHRSGYYAAEDTVTASLQWASGILGSGAWSFVSDPAATCDRMEILGEKGRIVFSTFRVEPVRLYRGTTVEEFAVQHPEHIQQHLIQQVVDALRFHRPCVSTGESAARTNYVMERILLRRSGIPA